MSPQPLGEERPRIYGLETEHTVLYIPEEAAGAGVNGAPRPPFDLLQEVLFDCLLCGRKSACSSGVKGGYFLENGGLVHLELFLRRQSDTPVLEVSTPECRSPWDLLNYSRAYDEILEETSRRSQAALLEKGHRGQIAFGKGNLDARGVGIGCHENYLVYCPPVWSDYLFWGLAAPFLGLCFLPAFLIMILVLLFMVAFLLACFLLGFLAGPIARRIDRWLRSLRRSKGGKKHRRLIETGRAMYYFSTHAILFPAMKLYSVLLRALALRPFIRDLTAFLVTRQVIAGSGSLNFRRGTYELSQRSELTRSLGDIIMFGRRKTFFDFKAFLFDPLALFRGSKKLTLAVGDSNLSDIPNLLKFGTAALVIEMIESGVSFEDLRLKRAVKALKTVSQEGPWKAIRLRSGRTLTALEIQREYLERAREYFKDRPPGRLRHGEILKLWEETLDRVSDRPAALSDTLDWVSKKSLLDQAVLAHTNWKVFFAWGRVLEAAGLEVAAGARSLPELIRQCPLPRRLGVRRLARLAGLDPSEFSGQRDLYFQARKIDLRFHELGGGTGYQRTLELEGLIRKLADPALVARAVKEAPQDTRARVRGYYIQNSKVPLSLQVSWTEIELRGRVTRHIPTPDPFHHRLPLE